MNIDEAHIGPYRFDEYLREIERFHGYAAPGLVIGGFMVEAAQRKLPAGTLFDALCETAKCLPDAIQILTPCTIGNGWLKIVDLGRFALCLYDKYTGEGIRVFLDPVRLEPWPELKSWFLKQKPKKDQDAEMILSQIKAAGYDLLGEQPVRIRPGYLAKRPSAPIAICSRCREAYPQKGAPLCPACEGEDPYITGSGHQRTP